MDKRRRISTANHLDEDMDDNSSEQSASISTRKRKRLDPVSSIYHTVAYSVNNILV